MSTSAAVSRPGFFQRLNAFRERHGSTSAIYKAFDVVLQKAFRTSVHHVVWLEHNAVESVTATDPRFVFRFLTADEVEQFAQDPSYYLSPTLAGAIRRGEELCFGALAGDRLAAFGCYTVGYVNPQQAAGAAISFPPDVAYMSFGLTHPDFRGYRLHGLHMGLALQELAKRGITKLVSIVSWTNLASLKSCQRLGYTSIGKMVTIGGRKHAVGFYPQAASRLGVRFGRKAKRTNS
ncbi:MAG TPA: GNAT family N-acetyltransferase [Lacipirellulaceae bacterium]|jgi:ribosomal protein S18 acetylase RimI-like enzyme|nr:GNAT family N-acetyltransferase [Lacipirellulaceae bacterium]